MKKIATSFFALICAVILLLSFSACAMEEEYSVKNLGASATATRLTYQELQDDSFHAVANSAESFANKLSTSLYATRDDSDNFVISPISVYMALALASECAMGDTRDEILSAFELSYDTLQSGFSLLYRSLWSEHKDEFGGALASQLKLTNSIWVDNSVSVKDKCINTLSNRYYCYSYSADFANDNSGANKAIRRFVSDQTNKMIDMDFDLPVETAFAIINTLYLKDVWNAYGRDLSYAEGKYDFTAFDGKSKQVDMLQGYYCPGNAYETDSFTHFYTKTFNGYKLKFILPKDGYSVDDVFTSETLELVNNISNYNADDHENKIHYYTRCIFPEFSAMFNDDLIAVLQSVFGINTLFNPNACSFATLTETPSYCGAISHVAKLNVDKTGIEGAAVTIEVAPGAAGPDGYEDIYNNFVVDGTFGFILTDSNNITLFSGVIGNVD